MNIDERIDRLTERHEALTQSVEMLLIEGREQDKRIDKLDQKLSGHIEKLSGHVEKLSGNVEKLSGNVEKLVGLVEKLTDIAKTHEDHLNGLEGNA